MSKLYIEIENKIHNTNSLSENIDHKLIHNNAVITKINNLKNQFKKVCKNYKINEEHKLFYKKAKKTKI